MVDIPLTNEEVIRELFQRVARIESSISIGEREHERRLNALCSQISRIEVRQQGIIAQMNRWRGMLAVAACAGAFLYWLAGNLLKLSGIVS